MAAGTCQPTRFTFDAIIVLDYDPRTETYHLIHSLRDDPMGRGPTKGSERYRPEDRIVVQPWTTRQRNLLLAAFP